MQLSLILRRVLGRSKFGKMRKIEIIPLPSNRWLDPFFAIPEPIEGISEFVKQAIPKAQESFRKANGLANTAGIS